MGNRKVVKRINPKSSHDKEKYFLPPPPLIFFWLCFMRRWLNILRTSYGNHFTMQVNQIIMLYTLGLTMMHVNYFSIELGEK